MSRILIDENLPSSLIKILPSKCSHARDLGRQLTDSQLWNHARQNGAVLLTRDADFFDRVMLYGPPPKVVWVRLGNIRRADLETLLLRLWPSVCRLLEQADLVEVHPDKLEAVVRHGGETAG